MSRKYVTPCLALITLLLLVSCSTETEKQLRGKWILASKIVGSAPHSFWFKSGGRVVAPWQEQSAAMISSGTYDFIDDSHIKIFMDNGHYKGITYYFKIVKVDDDDLVLRGSIQEIKMRRVE